MQGCIQQHSRAGAFREAKPRKLALAERAGLIQQGSCCIQRAPVNRVGVALRVIHHPEERCCRRVVGQRLERSQMVRAIGGRNDDALLAAGHQFRIHHDAGGPAVAVGERVHLADQEHHEGRSLKRFDAHVEPGWSGRIRELQALLAEGDAIQQMMQVTGEEGITLQDFVTHQKAVFLDMVYLQQDAFDPVDSSASLDRQKQSLSRVHDLVARAQGFPSKEAAREHFTRLTGLLKNLNYADTRSPEHADLLARIKALSASAP